MHKHMWRQASIRLIPYAALFVGGAVINAAYGNVRRGTIDHKLVALVGVVVFVTFAVAFLHLLTSVIHGLIASHRLGAGRAAAIQFILRTFGYIAILLTTLELVGIPVGRILLGSAVLGIILGVAAQQALANFFASFVLILSHPFVVGETISLSSGALGGQYIGTVIDIGLTHTRIKDEKGNVVFLPNATLLAGAAIMAQKQDSPPKTSQQ
jgi:small-conductance mechanosensitive channel